MGIIVTGLILILVGAYGIYAGYSSGNWGMAGVGWGSLIIGTLSILFGVGKRASEKVSTPHREVADHAQAEIHALIQAMGVVAVADDKIRDIEIETIVNVHDQMLGVRITHEEVREILSEFGPDFDIVGRLTANRGKISPTMKRTIVQCCQLVMVSDREVVVPEQNKVQQIGLALGFDQTEIEDLVASAGQCLWARSLKSRLESSSGASLAIYSWVSTTSPKGIVHINHGMSEHCARYDRFATALNKAGYHVIAHDHRGHGETNAPDTHHGLFAKSDGWNKVLADVAAVNAHAKESWPDLPVIYFGHSMGSIIGLNYCIRHSDTIDAAALWNSGVDGGPLLTIYAFLLNVERMFKGSDVPSGIASKLTFETWNKEFKPNRTESDWLSRDDSEVDKYISDPLCGFDACNGLWRDLLEGIRAGGNDTELGKIRNDLPMHLLAGGKDPCSDKGKAVERVYNRLKQTGLKDVSYVLHDENRHESLNELNRDELTTDFIQWLDERFAK